MCKIKKIEINNFRGIRSLQIDDLRRVNVILGNNNCGKSSLLEAVLIMMGADKPSLPIEMNFNRNYMGLEKDDFSSFFHDMDTESPIKFHASYTDGKSRQVIIRYNEEKINEVDASRIQESGNAVGSLQKYGLEFECIDGGEETKSSVYYNTAENKMNFSAAKPTSPRIPTFFMCARYNFNEYIMHFNQIVTDKEKPAVIEALQTIEPKISDVVVVGDNVKVDVQLQKLIPINLMGDGTRKLFTVATALYNAKNGILIIDEVDNGLYHKSMKALWNLIITTATKLNAQVLVSTHSIDSLRALNSLLTDKLPDSRDDVKIYTLRKNVEDNVTCYPYEYDKFSYLLDMEEEIR